MSMRLQQFLRFLSRSDRATRLPQETQPAPDGVLTPSAPPKCPDRLEVQTAIIQHLEWCVLFNEHLSVGSSDNIPLMPLPNATDSGLGRWLEKLLQGPCGPDPRLKALAEEHAHFHRLAERACTLVRQDRMDLASTLLNTDFERSRARVLELLRALQKS
jgi:hypothetical protein